MSKLNPAVLVTVSTIFVKRPKVVFSVPTSPVISGTLVKSTETLVLPVACPGVIVPRSSGGITMTAYRVPDKTFVVTAEFPEIVKFTFCCDPSG